MTQHWFGCDFLSVVFRVFPVVLPSRSL